MDCSMPGLLVHHQLPESTQTHVHQVGDAIQPSHPLSSTSPPALNLSQHQSLSNKSVLCIKWPKYWSFGFNISPSNEYSGLISFRMDWLDLLAVQGTLQESSPTPQFKSINSSALKFSFQPLETMLNTAQDDPPVTRGLRQLQEVCAGLGSQLALPPSLLPCHHLHSQPPVPRLPCGQLSTLGPVPCTQLSRQSCALDGPS